MVLTAAQKAEIAAYIVTVPKYRETYNELYDHILNAMEDSESDFSINQVNAIVDRDFGGFSEVTYQEKVYQKDIGKKYNKYFRTLFISTLKWPGVLILAFCLLIYFSSKTSPFNVKPMLIASVICSFAVGIFGYATIVVNRFRYAKYSILDSYLGLECSFGMCIVNLCLNGILVQDVFNLSDEGRLIAILSLHFFCVIYVRTFIKTYRTKFKILTA